MPRWSKHKRDTQRQRPNNSLLCSLLARAACDDCGSEGRQKATATPAATHRQQQQADRSVALHCARSQRSGCKCKQLNRAAPQLAPQQQLGTDKGTNYANGHTIFVWPQRAARPTSVWLLVVLNFMRRNESRSSLRIVVCEAQSTEPTTNAR